MFFVPMLIDCKNTWTFFETGIEIENIKREQEREREREISTQKDKKIDTQTENGGERYRRR